LAIARSAHVVAHSSTGKVEWTRYYTVGLDATLHSLAHYAPYLREEYPEVGALVHLDILPECATIIATPVKDVGELGQGVDVCTLDGGAVLLSECTTTYTIYGPVVCYVVVGVERLKAHAVGMKGLEYGWFPDELYLTMGTQGVEYSLVGKVTLACCCEAAI
jgi:hypothetical protein